MFSEQTSLMVSNSEQTNQSQTSNMTPEQEHNTRVMACDIQRFYECNERNWPENWQDNERDLMDDLKTFRHMAKHLLQQWTRDVAAQILSVRNTALNKLFTTEDVSLAAKLEPNSLEGKVGPLDWAQSELAFDKTLSKFRFLANDMLQGMKGGPTMERPGHPWTRIEGFDVLNLMIKNVEDPDYEDEEEDLFEDDIVPFYGFY
ncbi:hypothetical protein FAGAP_11356 [Fusarium agapanthi]|uniref:Uncharacterized protein n=1 Tax=Fusarium agapanthi TaxID=1803897 RepID=A0A9P5B0D5_9HYPO|nr:hypothetical protein FAGAP_11356 [Fusarium agapanthi]